VVFSLVLAVSGQSLCEFSREPPRNDYAMQHYTKSVRRRRFCTTMVRRMTETHHSGAPGAGRSATIHLLSTTYTRHYFGTVPATHP